jgi:pimeloyl-ACP methyl ester carboxylesterase
MLATVTTAVEPRERTTDLRGLRFHWVEWGEPGAPVVLALHGMSAMCRIWDPLAVSLQDRYHVIALDQRGHGDTTWPSEPAYGTEDYVADLEALFEHMRFDAVSLAGLSMGGFNSMALAARHPERVTRLVVVDIRPAVHPERAPTHALAKITADSGHPVFPDLEAAYIARKLTHPYTPEASLRHHIKQLTKQLPDGQWTFKHDPRVSYYWSGGNLWGQLPSIHMPVLIVRGGKSQVLSEQIANDMRSAFPNADLLTIEEAGHTVPEDQPEKFVAAVEDFFARNPA